MTRLRRPRPEPDRSLRFSTRLDRGARRDTALRSAFCLALVSAASALAALVPTEWSHRQTLTVPAAGLVRVEPNAATFDTADANQADLRIVDPAGRELAYLLDRPPTPQPRTIVPAAFEAKVEAGTTRLILATGTNAPLDSVRLETPHPFFLRAATLEISDNREQWQTVEQGVPLFRQWGAEKLELALGGRTAAFVRVTLNDQRGAPVPFTGAVLRVQADAPPALVPIAAQISSREEFAGETVLTLTLAGRHVPLAALELPARDALFMRRVTVGVRELDGTAATERIVATGSIFRVALDGTAPRNELVVPLDFTPATREILVHIFNGDSPPLAFDSVTVKRRAAALLAVAPAAGAYTLLSGNPQASAPRYDLALLAGDLRSASATTLTPGPLEPMPGYQPRDSLSGAALPDVALNGAPLSTEGWTQSRPIQIATTGVQELELDLSALAGAQPDYRDLRVLQNGNQLPYLLERPSLSRALTLKPVAAPDPKRPAVSVWQIKLPATGLPLRRVVLSSSTALFQRDLRVFEKQNSVNGGTYELNLAQVAWSRTPEPGVPETIAIELSSRVRGDTLWFETDNGDNPALALGDIQVVYPVVRVLFKTAQPTGASLIYGNKSISAPRYDLALVASKLLTAPRHPARLNADDVPSSANANPFAALKAGYLFWGALAIVVIALLAVVAKLLPKPPAN